MKLIGLTLGLLLALVAATDAQAANCFYTGADATDPTDWADTDNWSAAVPGTGDYAYVGYAGSVGNYGSQSTVIGSGTSAQAYQVHLGYNTTQSGSIDGTLTLNGGDLNVVDAMVVGGYFNTTLPSSGTLNISHADSTLSVGTDLWMGNSAGTTSTITWTAGDLDVGRDFYLGTRADAGTLTLPSGGTLDVGNLLYIGYGNSAASNGRVVLDEAGKTINVTAGVGIAVKAGNGTLDYSAVR